jgi:lysylphosphatidylglycerol synthetase-like protein (DUF2156 family)
MESRTLMANRSSLIRIVALVMLASGLANLYSVISPLSPSRPGLLLEILPLEFLTRFNFVAPMSGFQEREEASAMERAVCQFFRRLTFLFGFGGLKAYKAKFASSWEARYVIYRHALDLPRVGIAPGKVSKLK